MRKDLPQWCPMSRHLRPPLSPLLAKLGRPALAPWHVLKAWGRLLLASAMLLVMLLSRRQRKALDPHTVARALVQACWPLLPKFMLGFAILTGLVFPLLRDELLPLGLTHLESEVAVRLFMAQLLPWACALAMLLSYTLPESARLCRQSRKASADPSLSVPGHLSRFAAALPTLQAALLGMGLLFVCNAVLLLAVNHLVSYGWNPWALSSHATQIGRIFTPAFTLVLVIKMCTFACITALFPLVSYVNECVRQRHNSDMQLRVLVRVVMALMLVDTLAFLAWYA
jgi:hypothetical protein